MKFRLGFQAKENTFVERKAKKSAVEIRQEIRAADCRRLGPKVSSGMTGRELAHKVEYASFPQTKP